MFAGATVLVLMLMGPVVSMKAELLQAILVTVVEHLTLSALSHRGSIIQIQPPPIAVMLFCTGQNMTYQITKHSPVGGMIRTFHVRV